jgi:hypothetical protein
MGAMFSKVCVLWAVSIPRSSRLMSMMAVLPAKKEPPLYIDRGSDRLNGDRDSRPARLPSGDPSWLITEISYPNYPMICF